MNFENAPSSVIASEINRLTSILIQRAESVAQRSFELPPEVQCILRIILHNYHVSFREIASTKRTANLVEARHTFITLCRELTHHNTPAIALFIREDMHHSSIVHAHAKILDRIETDSKFSAKFEDLKTLCIESIRSISMPLFTSPHNEATKTA